MRNSLARQASKAVKAERTKAGLGDDELRRIFDERINALVETEFERRVQIAARIVVAKAMRDRPWWVPRFVWASLRWLSFRPVEVAQREFEAEAVERARGQYCRDCGCVNYGGLDAGTVGPCPSDPDGFHSWAIST